MKSEVLDRIREAIKSGPIATIGHEKFGIEQGRVIAQDLKSSGKISLFAKRAESSGSKVHLVDNIGKLKTTIKDIIADNSSLVVTCENQLRARLQITASELVPSSCELVKTDELNNDNLFELDAAITDVTLAIAETGSIVISAKEEYSQLTSLVSGIHVALVWPDQIVADMMDFAKNLTGKANYELPSSITVISGPSKTADIEIKLVIGVHGPAQLHLIIINENCSGY